MIFIFVGESACGKTTLMPLVSEYLKLEKNIGYTTRPKRIGEVYGVHNYFVTEERLNAMGDDIIVKREYFPASGDKWIYGMSKSSFNENFNYAIILDPLGAQQLKEIFSDSKIIYIKVPEKIRRERAYGRENKTLDPEIERRFKSDVVDFEGIENIVDCVVLNINIQDAIEEISNYVGLNIVAREISDELDRMLFYGQE